MAYKRTRTGTKKPATRRTTLRSRSKYARARTGLARFAYSRRRMTTGRQLSNMLNKIGETKLIAVTPQNNLAPFAIQTGAIAYCRLFCMGQKPASWTSGWKNMDGISISQGDTAQQRDGNYVYLDHTRLTFNIDTQNNTLYRPPIEYRVIVGKSRRGINPAGVTQDPSTDLFINNIGKPFGHTTSGINGTDLMLQPLNKRDWYIKMDRKFTLSVPLEDVGGGYSGKYATTKNFSVRLPYNKKTKYGNDGALQNLPLDLDTSYFVVIYARSQQKAAHADDWEVNLRGTTCFKDV